MSRLQRIVIHNFRGVRHFERDVAGKSCVIFGPNGCGKSSVADAIDFVLTGQVQRLTGEGAQGLSISRHGKHVAVQPNDSWVECSFDAPGVEGGVVRLRRSAAKPEELVCEGQPPADLAALLVAARSGSQHLLTRRNLLRFIFTPPSERMDQVAALLHLRGVDSLREAFQGAARDADEEFRFAMQTLDMRKSSVFSSVIPRASNKDQLLERVNERRRALGAAPIASSRDPIRGDVIPPADASAHPLQTASVKANVEWLRVWVTTGAANAKGTVREFVDRVRSVQADASTLKALRAGELIALGLPLATEGECPLCQREWVDAELRAFLDERLATSASAREANQVLLEKRQKTSHRLTERLASLQALGIAIADRLPAVAAQLDGYAKRLSESTDRLLIEPLQQSLPGEAEADALLAEFDSDSASRALVLIDDAARALPKLTGAQQAWDELAAVDRALTEYRDAARAADRASKIAKEVAAVRDQFIASRDAVLNDTYLSIANAFAGLYRQLHSSDESAFQADLLPTNAGLKLEVDFHGQGKYPPVALHSEGHQDSMGVCLFLALADHLSGGAIPLVVLDDVVMSVDHGHRHKLAGLLRDTYSKVQFIITTHDRVWYNQLRSLRVVGSENCVEITDWDLEIGPHVALSAPSLLAQAEEALVASDVRRAAHLVRTAVEAHFGDICDGLGAMVRYRADGEYGAGPFQIAAPKRLKEVLVMAKKAETSWGNDVSAIDALEARRSAAATGFQEENWAVNVNVHYNAWADFQRADFEPVLAAQKAFFEAFTCERCSAAYRVTYEGIRETGLRCDCGRVNFTFIKKSA